MHHDKTVQDKMHDPSERQRVKDAEARVETMRETRPNGLGRYPRAESDTLRRKSKTELLGGKA